MTHQHSGTRHVCFKLSSRSTLPYIFALSLHLKRKHRKHHKKRDVSSSIHEFQFSFCLAVDKIAKGPPRGFFSIGLAKKLNFRVELSQFNRVMDCVWLLLSSLLGKTVISLSRVEL
jgi:hypothetical protein